MANSRNSSVLMTYSLLHWISTFSNVGGCGQLPQGQERIINFTAAGFILPSAMAYSDEVGVTAQIPGISRSMQGARNFVRNLLVQSINQVLEERGRNAGLGDDLISLILQQISIEVNYQPLRCNTVFTVPKPSPPNNMFDSKKERNCFIISNTVTSLCINGTCDVATNLASIPQEHMSISGTLRVRNPIMATWPRETWQNILDRVARVIRTGSFATNFGGITLTLT